MYFLIKSRIRLLGFPGSSDSKESTCNVGDLGSILRLERSPGEGNHYPFQYSGLENSMDYIVSPWGRKESDTTERLAFSLEMKVVITRGSKISEYRCFFSVKNDC